MSQNIQRSGTCWQRLEVRLCGLARAVLTIHSHLRSSGCAGLWEALVLPRNEQLSAGKQGLKGFFFCCWFFWFSLSLYPEFRVQRHRNSIKMPPLLKKTDDEFKCSETQSCKPKQPHSTTGKRAVDTTQSKIKNGLPIIVFIKKSTCLIHAVCREVSKS